MELVIFGLTVSSRWGNGHAALWRGLIRALHQRGHRVVFFERDVPLYARHRDLTELPGGGALVLYEDWEEVRQRARRALFQADVGIVTSFCIDALEAAELMADAPLPRRVFYDLDTPVTLSLSGKDEAVPYLGPDGLRGYDLVLSYTGGRALDALRSALGAVRTAPLYGHVDPERYWPVPPTDRYRCDLSHLGSYAPDRQSVVDLLLVEPARRAPGRRFLLGGAPYPHDLPRADNLSVLPHVPPAEHPTFFCSSRLTLNVTPPTLAALGGCPTARLFEAAACGAPILSAPWQDIDAFFAPGEEILLARDSAEALETLERTDAELARLGEAARARALDSHTPEQRVRALERLLEL